MKITLLFLFPLLSLTLCAQPGEHKETIRREIAFPKPGADNLLIIQNISGAIVVEGYDGATVQIELIKTITADTDDELRRAREEVDLGVLERGGVVACYFQSPCSQVNAETVTEEQLRKGWDWNWRNNCRWDPSYQYRFDYRVRVPKGASLRLATVNEGNIEVRHVAGPVVQVNNVNGAITLDAVAGTVKAHTINGDLTVRFQRNPQDECSFYTLNGNINAYFQPGLAADLHFKSFNGDFFTDLNDVEQLPPALEKKESPAGSGIKYKIGGGAAARVGKGGVRLDFETFNGNAYVRGEGLR